MSVGAVAAIVRARITDILRQRDAAALVIQHWRNAYDALRAATGGAQSQHAASSR